MEVSYSSFRLKAELIRCCWAVGKVEIAPLLRDFQAEWKSPAVGLFRGASFSTAVLPTNCAKDPDPYCRHFFASQRLVGVLRIEGFCYTPALGRGRGRWVRVAARARQEDPAEKL